MAVQTFNLWKGTTYTTPPIPSKIRGDNLPIEDQIYTRHTEYEKWSWNDNPKNGALWWDAPGYGQLKWYYDEVYRILNGEWIMIEGKPVYLNLFVYFYLQWFYTKEGDRPLFKDTCVRFMYFMEVVFFHDKKCRGGNCMKGRRKHVSTMCMSVMLQFGLIKQNIEQGITSMAAIDAEKIFQLMLVNGYSRLPNFLKPRMSGTDDPKTILHLIKKAGVISKDKNTGSEKEGLNNRMYWRAPKPNVFDGDGLWFLLLDEAGKWPPDVPIDAYLEIALNIITAGRELGRIIIITTVNRGDKGGAKYKIVWNGSDQSKLDELGQTKNKLIQYFIEGYMGGRDLGWVDKYGNSVWDTPTPEQTEWLKNDPYTLNPYIGCKAYCELQRRLKANDPEKLAEEIRMFPFTPEEVFKGANNACYFNTDDLNDQISRVEARLELGSLYRKGWFQERENGDAYWVDAPLGTPDDNKEFMWYILAFPPQDECNRRQWKGGQMTPDNTGYGAMGADLINNSETTAEKGSDAAMAIFKRYNALDSENSGMFVAFGRGRPKSTRFQHDQMFLAARFYGIKILIERSPIEWHDYATQKKLLGYCIKTTQKINGNEVYGIGAQDGEGRTQHLTEMIEYADMNMNKIWFLWVLNNMLSFDIKDRTLFDDFMASGYALMACRHKHAPIVEPEEGETLVRTYVLNGRH